MQNSKHQNDPKHANLTKYAKMTPNMQIGICVKMHNYSL